MARKAQASVPPPRRDPDENLTTTQVCRELKIARSTLYEWWAKNRGPHRSKLPNGKLRVTRRDLDEWYKGRLVA